MLDAASWAVPLRAVGWLEHGHGFAVGAVPATLVPRIERLLGLFREHFTLAGFRGLHECDLCRATGRRFAHPLSYQNLLIPGRNDVYAAPGGLVHYISDHSYLPPAGFLEGVASCPDPGTRRYLEALRDANAGVEPPLESPGVFFSRDSPIRESLGIPIMGGTPMIALGPACRERIAALFPETDVLEAERLLEQCTSDPRLLADLVRQGTDRLLFAMIRLSGGDTRGLLDAISQFRRDWRDLLIAADFADDPRAHETWQPRRLRLETVERWMAGELPAGVKFALDDPVEIRSGVRRGATGSVISLCGLEPEPSYLLQLADAEVVEVHQSALQTAGQRAS
jgi:hypothetical protein